MSPHEVIEVLRAEPFRPFRVELVTGETYDVRHPRQGFVGRHELVLGLPAERWFENRPFDRAVDLPLEKIVRLTPLDEAPTGS